MMVWFPLPGCIIFLWFLCSCVGVKVACEGWDLFMAFYLVGAYVPSSVGIDRAWIDYQNLVRCECELGSTSYPTTDIPHYGIIPLHDMVELVSILLLPGARM